MKIPFNRPYLTGQEQLYINEALAGGHLSGDGTFTKRCSCWLEQDTGCKKALLTHSGTAALEMAAILADIQPGDEIIMPSYTFVSTANAFVLRGGIPVFVDVRPDTMNIDETKIEAAITLKTKVIVPVHYAGVACEMDTIMAIAAKYNLIVIEDAAQGAMASYKGHRLGSIGHMGALSFHETKNIIAGEGGALIINDEAFIERAEIIREKGTNRSRFFRGQVDKYSWVDIGSSYLPSEINAAFLYAQLESAKEITERRLAIWSQYYSLLQGLADTGKVRLPNVPAVCEQNGHMFYIKAKDLDERTQLIKHLNKHNIFPAFHYVPLHSSEAGIKISRFHGEDEFTTKDSEKLLRLPFYCGLMKKDVEHIVSLVQEFYEHE